MTKTFDIEGLSHMKLMRGWITPDGKYFDCEMYCHLDSVFKYLMANNPSKKIRALEEKFRENEQAIEDEWKKFTKDWDGGGGHEIEIWADKMQGELVVKLYKVLYQIGWIKFSSSTKSGVLHLDVEGHSSHIQSKRKYIRELEDEMFVKHNKKPETNILIVDRKEVMEGERK